MIPTQSVDEVRASLEAGLASRTPINNFAEGSTAGLITGTIAELYDRLQNLLVQADAARDINTAVGTDLDNLARAFGLTRRQPTTAGADSGASQLLVTNNSTTLTLSFPAGTAVWSPTNPAIRFYTVNTVSITPQGAASVYLQAQRSGQVYTASAGTLTNHNSDANFSVTNFLPISGGAGAETDDEFRFRISQTLQAAVTGGPSTADSITTMLRSQPGILDVILIPEARGAGTIDVIVVPTDGQQPDDDFLTSVQEIVASVAACGISIRVLPPDAIPIDVEVQVSVSGGAAATPQAPLRQLLQTVATNYINSRRVYVAPRANTSIVGTATDIDTQIDYTTLLGSLIDAARGSLGSRLRNLTLLLGTGSGETILQGDLHPRDGQVFRLRSARVTLRADTP